MTTSTLSSLTTGFISTFWDYLTTVVSPVVTFGIALAVLLFVIGLVLRKAHIL